MRQLGLVRVGGDGPFAERRLTSRETISKISSDETLSQPFGVLAMHRLRLLGWSALIIATLTNALSGPAIACDPNANCKMQECSGPTRCVEVIDKVCEAHKAACLAFPPSSRNPASIADHKPSPVPLKQERAAQQRPTTAPGRTSIFDNFDSEKKQQFVNLVANEWLVKTTGNSPVQVTEKVMQETLMGAAAQMPNLTDDERKTIVREVLENRKEFSELHAATNAVLATLTEHDDRPSSSSTVSSENINSIKLFPCPRQNCD